ncbi:MAG: TetR/AcrR family transcriptional regulator [Christensenellales bacterium]
MKDTKENILQVALGLFARDGYEAVSVSEIAGALGITKGALYRHYAGKRDIFDSILARMGTGRCGACRAIPAPGGHVGRNAAGIS